MKDISRRLVVGALPGAVFLSACAVSPVTGAINPDPGGLEGEWVLNGLHTTRTGEWADLIKTVSLNFGSDGRISGYSGCNRFFGSFSVEGDRVKIGPLASTKRGCFGGAGSLESAVLANLAQVTTFERRADRLHLEDAAGRTVLTYQKKTPLTLQGTEQDIIFYRRPYAIQSVVNNSGARISFGDGRFEGFSGCNQFGGRFAQNGDFLKLTDLVMTEAGCSPDLMEQESFIFGNLGKVRRLRDNGRSLWLQDADGNNLLQLVRRKQ